MNIVLFIYLILNGFFVAWVMDCSDSFLNRADRLYPYTLSLKETIKAIVHEITIGELILLFIFPIFLIIIIVSIIVMGLFAGTFYLAKRVINLWRGKNIPKVIKTGLKSIWSLLTKRPFAKKKERIK